MRVMKRSGKYEDLSFDKVTRRIKTLCTGLQVSPEKITQKAMTQIVDLITTAQIDEISADIAANMSTEHPDYEICAARIYVSNMQKKCPKTFLESLQMNHLIDPELVEIATKNVKKLQVKKDRDNLFGYFGLKTMEKIYLGPGETPGYMFMRVALGIHRSNIPEVINTYEMLSTKQIIHATPTMINSGKLKPQMSSCFLTEVESDSISGIYNTLGECAQISKHAGGIGIHIQNIRANGSRIRGTNGKSDGIIPMLRVFNSTARYVNQGGARKGSFAVYLEPWHADIMEFLELRLNQGDEESRCRDLFTALWIPDLFMKTVEKGGEWALFCPDECPGLSDVYGEEFDILYNKYLSEGRQRKLVPVSMIWNAIIKSQIETGTPYMLYKDTCNARSNQRNLGTLKGSNLCVAPETPILTDNGYLPISSLENKNVNIWNGSEWSGVQIKKTSDAAELIRVEVDTGTFLECTPEHKFWVKNDYYKNACEMRAKDLQIGDKLIKFDCEPIEFGGDDFKYPYTHGFFCGDGTYGKNYKGDSIVPLLSLYGEKMNLIEFLDIRNTSGKVTKENRINCSLPYDMPEKFIIPDKYSIKVRLEWLSGLFDADGCLLNSGSIQLASIHKDFLYKIYLMLHTLGVQSKITLRAGEREPDGKGGRKLFKCKPIWMLGITQTYLKKLVTLGLRTHRINLDNIEEGNRKANWFPKVLSVSYTGRISPTFCFTEPKKHLGVFNGLLTGQCTEILEYTSKDEIAVCNLASISLPSFVTSESNNFNFERLHEVTKQLVTNLNNVIDNNFYPVEKGAYSNKKNRPIGIGVQGLADVYMVLGYPFDSKEAFKLNHDIFETIYHGAIERSVELAKEHGVYGSFVGSPASEGLLQFDLAGRSPGNSRYDWDSMKTRVRQTGLRNSLLVAPMPTATTSQVLGNNECFEPYTTNIYLRRTLAGEFVVINKHLLTTLGPLWTPQMKNRIIENGGSIQNIPEISDSIKSIFKTSWEISQKVLIDQARDRGAYICQSQSMNLFVEDPTLAKLSSIHMYTWKQGLKTGMYYLRTRPKAKPIQVTVPVTVCKFEPGCMSCGS